MARRRQGSPADGGDESGSPFASRRSAGRNDSFEFFGRSISEVRKRSASQEPPQLRDRIYSDGAASMWSIHSYRGHLPNAREDFEEHGHTDHRPLRFAVKAITFFLTIVVAPILCRRYDLSIPQRCGVLFLSVLVLNLAEALPLYCLSLFIPVLGTLCAVLGDKRSMSETANLLVGHVFTNVSFLVLGALVTNGIFAKCGIDQRMIRWLLCHVPLDDPKFLLLLMLGTTAVASVLYSASMMLMAALRAFCSQDPREISSDKMVPIPVAKRVLLGVAFASNAGSTWLPISSPVNLVAMGLLDNFDKELTTLQWIVFAVPVSTTVIIGSWAFLMLCFPTPPEEPQDPEERPRMRPRGSTCADQELDEVIAPVEEFTTEQKLFMFLACCAIILITAFPPQLEAIFGHPAMISLTIVVVTFGSGFMDREEFLELDWDLLAIVGGTNVMAFLVRDTGLGATLSKAIVSSPYFEYLTFSSMIILLVCGTLSVSSLLGHTMSGVILLPLIIAVGVKVQAAQTVALICTVAVPFGMGFSHSSFDNVAAQNYSARLGKEEAHLERSDFGRAGNLTTVWGATVLLTLGPWICEQMYGSPPPLVVAEISDTPEELKPKVVKESLPEEVGQVKWRKDQLADWNDFMKQPDKKAFAVGTIKGMQTRGWAAAWNHRTQEGANKAALEHCERLADKCRLIYPPDDQGKGQDWVKQQMKQMEQAAKKKSTIPEADMEHKAMLHQNGTSLAEFWGAHEWAVEEPISKLEVNHSLVSKHVKSLTRFGGML